MPEMVITSDVMLEFNAAPVTAAKLNESGVVSIGKTIRLLVELPEEFPSEPEPELPEELINASLLEELPNELMRELFSALLKELVLEVTKSGFYHHLPRHRMRLMS